MRPLPYMLAFMTMLLLHEPPLAFAEQQALIEGGKWQWPILRVLDGDTIRIRIPDLPPSIQDFSIRIRGIDAPELAPKAKCAEEAQLAQEAKIFTEEFLSRGDIHILHLAPDKYGNRWRADILVHGQDLGEALLQAHLARPYHGEKRQSWCGKG